MLHLNIAHLDEPEFDGKLNSDIEDRLEELDEYIPGLDVQENELNAKYFLNSDLKEQLEPDKAPANLSQSPKNN